MIELLVVISIIGILMSLMFPAIGRAIDSGKKAVAKNDVVQIANAAIAYEQEYGALPAWAGPGHHDVSGEFLEALTASTTAHNTRKVVFLSAQDARKGKSGITNNRFVDPWGGNYRYTLDTSYDILIESAGTPPGPIASNLRRKAAVWNEPNADSEPVKKFRSVASWE